MTIRNLDAFIGGIWDWAILRGCFGRSRIAPTDIDGLVERNGVFLVIEAKGSGKELGTGQTIVLRNLIKTGRFTVIVIWGKPNEVEQMLLMTRRGTKNYPVATNDVLRQTVARWYRWADALPTSGIAEDVVITPPVPA